MKYQITNFKVKIEDKDKLLSLVAKKYHLKESDIKELVIQKESVDARKASNISLSYNLILDTNKNMSRLLDVFAPKGAKLDYPKWNKDYRPIIVGFGPAGIFASLYLARCKANPIIIEQGSDMDKRIKAVEDFLTNKRLDESCNIQFGEGGAGTFSDGKLTTNLKDELNYFVLEEFVKYGAPKEILYESLPHIGTDYLRRVIKAMREDMTRLGAEFYFDTKFIDYESTGDRLLVKTSQGDFETKHLILGLGHSARDTFKMLHKHRIHLEPKSFSMGVRIEHLREKINQIQYKQYAHLLKAASYKLAVHLENRSVYSFCMCPGGEVMASQSEKNSILTNGMSYYDRNKDNSNAALLVNVDPSDYYVSSPLDGIYYQEKYERLAFEVSKDYRAPANLVKEFLNDEIAKEYRSVTPSYPHGVVFCDLYRVLPDYVVSSLKEALPLFDRKMPGFMDPDAVLTGVETRSSCPLRIIRDDNRESSERMIYPVGEGAGYAGGIMTAAVDGLKTAIHVAK